MRLTRRKFIIGSLVVIASPIIYKVTVPVISKQTGLELFFSNYKSPVTLNNLSKLSCSIDIELFKANLEQLLIKNPQEHQWKHEIINIIHKDYQNAKVEIADGWILSETELCIELLRAKNV